MVGNTGTLMTMRIVRSKLRKRDESSATAAGNVTIEAQQTHGPQNRSIISDNQDQQIFTSGIANDDNINNSVELETITFTRTSGSCSTTNGWVFPPKAPSPNIYNCDNHVSTKFLYFVIFIFEIVMQEYNFLYAYIFISYNCYSRNK